jgi:hypothetical protein
VKKIKLYDLQNKRYKLIQELQLLIAQQSKPEELSHSNGTPEILEKVRHYPLTWMIVGVKNNEGIIFDTNTNPLHQKLMEIYYIEHDIDKAREEQTKKFMNKKFKGLRTRQNDLQRSYKGLLEKYRFLVKKVDKLEKEKID